MVVSIFDFVIFSFFIKWEVYLEVGDEGFSGFLLGDEFFFRDSFLRIGLGEEVEVRFRFSSRSLFLFISFFIYFEIYVLRRLVRLIRRRIRGELG